MSIIKELDSMSLQVSFSSQGLVKEIGGKNVFFFLFFSKLAP